MTFAARDGARMANAPAVDCDGAESRNAEVEIPAVPRRGADRLAPGGGAGVAAAGGVLAEHGGGSGHNGGMGDRSRR